MKRLIATAVVVAVALCAACAGFVSAAEVAKAKAAPAVVKAPIFPPVTPVKGMPPARPMGRANVSMLFGTVTSVDAKDPSKVKLEVTTEADKKVHAIEVLPTTTVTKLTDISEVKKGDNVRVMTRKVDDKDVAMGVMFGNIRKPVQRPGAALPQKPAAPITAAPIAKEQPKK